MPRKKKVKDAPATEPTPVAEVLDRSPVMADILAAREAKSHIEPERPLPESEPGSEAVAAFLRQREREQAVEPPGRLETLVTDALIENQKPKTTHAERLKGLRPTPSGFVGLEGHYAAGIRLNRSLDKTTVAIQFADDRRPSRDGLNTETEHLRDRGFEYKPERAQWERKDREWPAENYQDAKQFVETLAKERREKADGVQR